MKPDVQSLCALHRAHMFSVPFENLDIHLGRPITLSLPLLFEKIVRNRRGGFCYELNGAFEWLLGQCGFQTRLLSAQVFHNEVPSPEFDHMLLLVELGGGDGPYIADVGFGDSFVDPLALSTTPQPQRDRAYRLLRSGERWTLQMRERDARWRSQYAFCLTRRNLKDFESRCRFQQTSPQSSFTQKCFCSRAHSSGRVTIAGRRLITTADGQRRELPIRTAEEYNMLLQRRFSICLSLGEASILFQKAPQA